MRSDGRRVLWLTGVGHASSHAWELVFPAVAVPMARELGLPFEDTITLSFILYLMFGLGAPLAGWATDRLGARLVLIIGLLGGGISGALVAFSPSLVVARLALVHDAMPKGRGSCKLPPPGSVTHSR